MILAGLLSVGIILCSMLELRMKSSRLSAFSEVIILRMSFDILELCYWEVI